MMNFKQTCLTLIGILIGVLIILISYYQNTGNSSQSPVLSPDSNLPNSNPINHKTVIDENVSNHEPLITSELDNAETKIIPILITENEFNLIINYIEDATITKIPEFIQDQVRITKINEIKKYYQENINHKTDSSLLNSLQKWINEDKKKELDINNEKEKFQKIKNELLTKKNKLELKIKNTPNNLKTPLEHELINLNVEIAKNNYEINSLNDDLNRLNFGKNAHEQKFQNHQKFCNDNNKYLDNYTKQNTKERLSKIYTYQKS